MLKTVLITGSLGMLIGFGETLVSLFGGGSVRMEFLQFAVALVLFLVMLIGSYWFVMVHPGMDKKRPSPQLRLSTRRAGQGWKPQLI